LLRHPSQTLCVEQPSQRSLTETPPTAKRMTLLLREYSPWVVAAAFTVSAPIHLVRPTIFTSIVPHVLPLRTELVYASGVAELACAIGLWRRDRWAGIASAILLVMIWPANLQGAITAQREQDLTSQVIGWLRLPLQIPLIWFALQSGRAQHGVRGKSPRHNRNTAFAPTRTGAQLAR
jgi:uncharacterized membrane protein